MANWFLSLLTSPFLLTVSQRSPFKRIAKTDPGAHLFEKAQQAITGAVQEDKFRIDLNMPPQMMKPAHGSLALGNKSGVDLEIEYFVLV